MFGIEGKIFVSVIKFFGRKCAYVSVSGEVNNFFLSTQWVEARFQ